MKNNRLLKVLLIVLIVFNSTSIVRANTELETKTTYESTIEDISTCDEPEMPVLTGISSKDSVNREEWKDEISKHYFKNYDLKVINIKETDTTITFEFDKEAQFVNLKDYLIIISVEYQKPEFNKYFDPNSEKSLTMQSKIVNYVTCSGSWVKRATKSNSKLRNILDTGILIASGIKIPVVEVISLVYGVTVWFIDNIDLDSYGRTQTFNQYMYYNKVCSVKPSTSSTWYIGATIGSKYTFAKFEARYTDIYGHAIDGPRYCIDWDGYTFPLLRSQYVDYDKKLHFSDNNWIKNKAIECYGNHTTYYDVYGIAVVPIN